MDAHAGTWQQCKNIAAECKVSKILVLENIGNYNVFRNFSLRSDVFFFFVLYILHLPK